jgi:hypothetical protein
VVPGLVMPKIEAKEKNMFTKVTERIGKTTQQASRYGTVLSW